MGTTSNRTNHPLRECLLFGACGAALVVCLPLLALVMFTLRPLVLGIALLAVVALASPWVIVPRLRGRWQADVAPEHAYKGLRLARDVGLHPGHSWAWIGEGEVVVGADDLAQAELGPIEEIELPAAGRCVRSGEPLFRLRHGGRSLALPAPVSGTVVRSNEELRGHPELVNRRPFTLGWVTRIRAGEGLDEERRGLLFGRKAWGWFRAEVDRVLGAAPPEAGGSADVEQLHCRIDEGAWRRITAGAFDGSEPRAAS